MVLVWLLCNEEKQGWLRSSWANRIAVHVQMFG